VHALGGGAFGPLRVPVLSLGKLWAEAIAAIRAEHRFRSFDAILGIWATESGWIASQAGRLLHRPVAVHLAGGELAWFPDVGYGNARRGLARSLAKASLRRADLVTAPSGPVLNLARRRGIQPDRLVPWSLGVDTELFSPTGEPERPHTGKPFVFATAGSLIPIKDHAWLINAFAELRRLAPRGTCILRIAGSGPLRTRLSRLADSRGLGGYVEFVGDIDHSSLPDFYRSARCFVLPSRYEAQCMAVLEAMACGLPWVGPHVGVLADLAFDEPGSSPTGIPVAERSPESLARAMLLVMDIPEETRASMGAEARRLVVERYSLVTQSCKLAGILTQLTASKAVARMT